MKRKSNTSKYSNKIDDVCENLKIGKKIGL